MYTEALLPSMSHGFQKIVLISPEITSMVERLLAAREAYGAKMFGLLEMFLEFMGVM